MSLRPKSKEVLRAIKAAGSIAQLADGIGTSRQAVHQWYVVPLNRVWDVERVTKIPHEELRPDFFKKEPKK